MNDFTKEELILILGLLRGAYSVSLHGKELRAEKIQSMIDNYCEHNPTYTDECRTCNAVHCGNCEKRW